MVSFLSVSGIASLLRTVGEENFLRRLAGYIEDDFRRWGDFEKSPRLASHSREGVIELMPTSDGLLYSYKYVNGHPINPSRGKLTVTAFGVLADVATGYPILLSEMTVATALRTAATSALAARHLARKDCRCMAIIGLGAQAEFQALAFKAVLGIASLRVFDVDPAATRKFQRNLHGRGFEIIVAASAVEAIEGADIVTTATAAKSREVIVPEGVVVPGVHINAIGGDCPGKTELHPTVLRSARIFVEYLPQSLVEGEIQQLPMDHRAAELWQVITGQAVGRNDNADITLFDSVGFAMEDFSTLRLLNDLLVETKAHHPLDLVPDLDDPKDLYCVVA